MVNKQTYNDILRVLWLHFSFLELKLKGSTCLAPVPISAQMWSWLLCPQVSALPILKTHVPIICWLWIFFNKWRQLLYCGAMIANGWVVETGFALFGWNRDPPWFFICPGRVILFHETTLTMWTEHKYLLIPVYNKTNDVCLFLLFCTYLPLQRFKA